MIKTEQSVFNVSITNNPKPSNLFFENPKLPHDKMINTMDGHCTRTTYPETFHDKKKIYPKNAQVIVSVLIEQNVYA
jgi:hypothetical protein